MEDDKATEEVKEKLKRHRNEGQVSSSSYCGCQTTAVVPGVDRGCPWVKNGQTYTQQQM